MRKEKIDVSEKFKTDRGEKKEVLNLVVVGNQSNIKLMFTT